MGIPFHSKLRRTLRNGMNGLIMRLSKRELNQQYIDPSQVKRILVIRINYRIGNILFLTPLLQAIAKRMPDAQVDLLIGANYVAPLMQPIANVGEVYDAPRNLLKNPFKLYSKVKIINQNNYDLIISPVVASGSANITTMLLKAKHKLGFYDEHNWNAADITVPYPVTIEHEALKPLALMAVFEQQPIDDYAKVLDIQLSAQEQALGRAAIMKLVAEQKPQQNIDKAIYIALFRDARHDKKIPDSWWQTYIEKLSNQLAPVIIFDILAPDMTRKLTDQSIAVAIKNLRELAGCLSAMQVFICADTGPMHLACAAQTPVVALFNATSPSIYGPLGARDKVIDMVDNNIDEVVNLTKNHVQQLISL